MLEETYLDTLKALRSMSQRDGLPPTMTELGKARGLSPSAIAKHYAVLKSAGLIRHTKRSPRSAVVTRSGISAIG